MKEVADLQMQISVAKENLDQAEETLRVSQLELARDSRKHSTALDQVLKALDEMRN